MRTHGPRKPLPTATSMMTIRMRHPGQPDSVRVALLADDTPVGVCGLFRREGLEEPDIGFSILPQHWRKGYAFEAASAVVRHAKTDIRLERLTAVVSTENAASVALIEKLGLQFERMQRLPGDDDDVAVYGMQLNSQCARV